MSMLELNIQPYIYCNLIVSFCISDLSPALFKARTLLNPPTFTLFAINLVLRVVSYAIFVWKCNNYKICGW